MKRFTTSLTGLILLAVLATTTQAVDIEIVPVGNLGNAADTRYDTTGYGAVNYDYSIGKYEVTTGQYVEFLNAVAKTDTYGLYSHSMWAATSGCKILRGGTSGSYSYITGIDWANRPVNFVSWGAAARFANWLANGQPTGDQNDSTTEDGSYKLNGANDNSALMAICRESDATWVIPTEDEWYKAAYHKNDGVTGNYFDYPTNTDNVPSNELIDPDPGNNATLTDYGYTISGPYHRTEVGAHENSESPYGTFDQGGNVWEWNEGVVSGSYRCMRSGDHYSRASYTHASTRLFEVPTYVTSLGFRVAFVPELSTDVSIDIKPDSDPNSINLGSNGNIPVAIFGTDAFDVTTVDLATIMLADAGVLERGKNGELMASFEDIDLDGVLDLLVHIDTQSLVLSDGDVEAHLTGKTLNGLSIFGTDAIRLVGKSGGHPTDVSTSEDVPSLAAVSIPEPGSIALLLCGLVAGLIWWRR